jgi:hypothetical protein
MRRRHMETENIKYNLTHTKFKQISCFVELTELENLMSKRALKHCYTSPLTVQREPLNFLAVKHERSNDCGTLQAQFIICLLISITCLNKVSNFHTSPHTYKLTKCAMKNRL